MALSLSNKPLFSFTKREWDKLKRDLVRDTLAREAETMRELETLRAVLAACRKAAWPFPATKAAKARRRR